MMRRMVLNALYDSFVFPFVVDLTMHVVSDYQSVEMLLNQGNSRRYAMAVCTAH